MSALTTAPSPASFLLGGIFTRELIKKKFIKCFINKRVAQYSNAIRNYRVVTRYTGSGIKGLKRAGIRDHSPGARFSKVPKLDGSFSRVTIFFVSQERRGFNSSNFTVIFLFVTLKTCRKTGFPKQAVGNFTDGFSGPKRFRDFRETGLWNLESLRVGSGSAEFFME